MPVWIVLGVCAAVFIMAIAVAGSFNLFNGGMPASSESQPRPGLSEGFSADDVPDLRFSTALRGYRMDEVDAALDALHERIVTLEARTDARSAHSQTDSTDDSADTDGTASLRDTVDTGSSGATGLSVPDTQEEELRPARDSSVPRTFPAGESTAGHGTL